MELNLYVYVTAMPCKDTCTCPSVVQVRGQSRDERHQQHRFLQHTPGLDFNTHTAEEKCRAQAHATTQLIR